MNTNRTKFFRNVSVSLIVLLFVFVMAAVQPVFSLFAEETVKEEAAPAVSEISANKADVMKFGLIAAAIAFGLGAIGAGIAIAHVGAAAMGAIGEKPEIAGQALIFIALAEGLVVFGFITALMILGKI